MKAEPTSASSQGSEGSTSPSKPTDSPASDRSSTSQPALPFSNDIGPEYPDGAMSTGSPLLPTPNRMDGERPHETPQEWDARSKRKRADNPNLGDLHRHLETEIVRASSSAAIPASRSATPVAEAEPRTPATYGPSSPVSLASFDPDGCCWRTYQATLASELPKFSQTLPRSGMTRHGQLFALPMWERRTVGSGGSALLPTVRTNEMNGTGTLEPPARRGGVSRRVARLMLPTPVSDNSRGLAQTGTDFQSLPNVVLDLDSRGDPTPPPSTDGGE